MLTAIHSFLHAERPGQTLVRMFADDAILPLIYLSDADSIPAGPAAYHSGSLLAHTARVMDEVAVATDGDALAVWMAFVHDCGKLTTPRVMLPHHYGHEHRGKLLAAIWGKEADVPATFIEAGIFAAHAHMNGGQYESLRNARKLRLLLEIEEKGLMRPFCALASADSKSRAGDAATMHWQAIRPLVEGMKPADIPDRVRQECLKVMAGLKGCRP